MIHPDLLTLLCFTGFQRTVHLPGGGAGGLQTHSEEANWKKVKKNMTLAVKETRVDVYNLLPDTFCD